MAIDAPETQATSPADVEDRLASMFSADEPEDDAPEQDTAEAPEVSEDDAADETTAEAPAEDDSEEVEYEGKAYKVPKELKPALLMRQDYTRKTMQLAEQAKQVEDRAQFLEARQQVLAQATQHIGELRAAEKQLEQFNAINWVELANADPGRAFALSQQKQDLERQVGNLRGGIQQVVGAAENMVKQHNANQWRMAVEGARKALGDSFTAEDDKRAGQLVRDMGFTEADMHRLADARVLQLVFDAARWRSLQEAKPGVNKRAEAAKPMKAVSRSAPTAQREGAAMQHRQALKKSGSRNSAEAYFETLFARKR